MKILIVSQYFWPENFRINDLTLNLKKQGYDVKVLTGEPNYPDGNIYKEYLKNKKFYDRFKNIKIYRVPIIKRGKGKRFNIFSNYLSFNITSIILGYFKFNNEKFDYIFTFGTSPITSALTSVFLAKLTGAKHVLWMLDLWPEVVFELKIIKNRIYKDILKRIIDLIYKKTDIFLAQSKSFERYLKKKTNKQIIYFPSWPENFKLKKNIYSNEISKNDNYLKIIFTGNLGEAQNFNEIFEAIYKLRDEKIKWIFVGGGRYAEEFKIKIQDFKYNAKIQFIKNQKIQNMYKFFNHADILLLSLKSGKFGAYTIPGKFQTYLKVGKPILCHASGEVKKLVIDNKLGFVSEPGKINLLTKNVENILLLKKKKLFNKYSNLVKKNSKLLIKKYSEKENLKNLTKTLVYNKKPRITLNMIQNVNYLFKRKNFIYSALNLAFLGSYSSNQFSISKNFYVWPDGLFGVNFMRDIKKVTKISGRKILSQIQLPKNIKEIVVIGNLPPESRNYLENKFKIKKNKLRLKEIKLPYGNIKKITQFLPKQNLRQDQIIILTLPTPKQEQVANYLSTYNKNYKILCLGGAINMLSGLEVPVPRILENYFEGIWRLQYDSIRRIKRLAITLFSYFSAKINRKFKDFEKQVISN